jgi:hypothetical protein
MKERNSKRAEKLMKRLLEDQGVNVEEGSFGASFDQDSYKKERSMDRVIQNAYRAISDLIDELDTVEGFDLEDRLEEIKDKILGPWVR